MYTLFESEEHIFTSLHAHLPSLSVMPAHPAAAVTAVLDPVSLGKLITHAVGVPTLGAHERDEVQRAQVHLEILFEAVRLWHDVRTPSPITVSVVKVKSDGEQENKWKSRYRKPRSQSSGTQTQGKRHKARKNVTRYEQRKKQWGIMKLYPMYLIFPVWKKSCLHTSCYSMLPLNTLLKGSN